jgi:hypothetical protein
MSKGSKPVEEFRFVGVTDERTACERCGRVELKRTIMLHRCVDGEPEELVYYGVDCAAKVLGRTKKAVLDDAVSAEVERRIAGRRAEFEAHPAIVDVRRKEELFERIGRAPSKSLRKLALEARARALADLGIPDPSVEPRRAVKAPSRATKPETVALLARIATWPNVRGAVPKVSTAAAIGMLRGTVALPMGSVAKPAKKARRSTNTGPEADCARMLAAKRWGKPWPPSKPDNDAPPPREPEVIEAEFIEVSPTAQSLATPLPTKTKRAKGKSTTSREIARITTWSPVNASAPRMQTVAALAMLSRPARALPMGAIATAAAIEPEPLGLEDVDLVVTHTLEEGTTITGNTRPWAEAIKGLGMAFKWFAPKRLWYRQQSRGRAAPTVPLERVAEGLRRRGATVRIEQPEVIDDVEANEFRADLLREKSARLEQRAEKKERAAEAKHAAAGRIADNIPLGQPILVGHHSEKRARRDADRIIDLTGQGIALHREAEQLARQARNTEARAEDALAQAEIARNRESIETFIEQLGTLLKKGLKAQVKATSVRLFANNKGDVTWYVGFDGAVIPIFMEPVVLVKATRAIRVADRTQVEAGSLSAEAAYVEVRNALARLKRVAIDPTMPAPDLRPSQSIRDRARATPTSRR